jgi:mutator protein MutT
VNTLVVTAAIVERRGALLVTRRLAGTHLEGLWEFPGGKCEPGESLSGCLSRELREELGVDATVNDEVFTTTHAYPDRIVTLHFLRCEFEGEPDPLLGQEIRWIRREQLDEREFPPADAELIHVLKNA